MRGIRWAVLVLLWAAVPAAAQQNLFNVPSGQVTKSGDVFFQQQFNFGPAGSSNTTLDFGLGHGWEVGVNYLDVLLYDNTTDNAGPGARRQVNPDVLLNVQKGFEISEDWNLGIGGQFGINPASRSRDVRFLNFSWLVNGFDLLKDDDGEARVKAYAGVYLTNVAYAGPGDRVGALAGVEVPIIKDRLSFQADYISGNNDLGVAVVGGVYTFKSGWQLSLGAQLPAPRSSNSYGVVMELTYPGYHLFER